MFRSFGRSHFSVNLKSVIRRLRRDQSAGTELCISEVNLSSAAHSRFWFYI